MPNNKTPVHRLSARDLMRRIRLSIPQDMTLKGAARLMSQAKVSAAPVTDADGRCIGLLSARAFLRSTVDGWGGTKKTDDAMSCVSCEWQMIEPQPKEQAEVRQRVKTDTPLIAPGTTLLEVARSMLEGRYHLAIVVDGHGRPIGIVSCTDVLSILAGEVHPPAWAKDRCISENGVLSRGMAPGVLVGQ